jgi:hypothetical protein
MIFNLGAPSHLDLWDMKPDAPSEIRGPFQTIETRVPGLTLSEVLPQHARIADKFSLVRSVHHAGPAIHDLGWHVMQTGRLLTTGGISPHVGSAAGYLLGRKTDLPPFGVLPAKMGCGGGNMPNGQSGGFLGEAHEPFVLNADPSQPNYSGPSLTSTSEVGTVRVDQRRKIPEQVDAKLSSFEAAEPPALLDSHFHAAYSLLTSAAARSAFDLSREPEGVRERYGRTRFGQCCLLARRLVEKGMRFVTINSFLSVFEEITWDIHGLKPFTTIEEMRKLVCPMYDRAYSALIEDLDAKGLLATTLVCNLAEFGRTPRINPAGGRDHWPQCFTVGFAGGGIQGGRVVGASDPIGAFPAERPVEPAEIAATIFHSLGLDLKTSLPGPSGQSLPLVDSGYHEIRELF